MQHFFAVALRPYVGHGLLILEVSRSHTTTHHRRYDSSGRVISSSQIPLPNNTQHSRQADIHAPGGIRTHDLNRRADEDLRLTPRGHWDRPTGRTSSSSSSSCSGRIRFDSCSLYPQNEIGPSISSSVVLCVFVLWFIL